MTGMETTAKQIAEWALAQMNDFAANGMYPNDTAMHKELAAISGVSESLIRQFRSGLRPSPSITTMDKIVGAIKSVKRLRAA